MPSAPILIIIQLIVILLLVFVFSMVMIRKLRKRNAENIRRIQALNKQLAKLRKQPRGFIESFNLADMNDALVNPNGDNTNIDNLFGEMDKEWAQDEDHLSGLDQMLSTQADTIARIKQMREAAEAGGKQTDDSSEVDNLLRALETARVQNKESSTVIASLKDSLEKNRIRLKKVEREMSRSRSTVAALMDVEKANKRLEQDKISLQKKLAREIRKHQDTVDRIHQKLSAAERKNQEYTAEGERRERSLLKTINELQEKLRAAADSADDEQIKTLEAALTDAQDELGRVVKEKTFIESHFVGLEKSLEESMSAKEELGRAKKEYQLLEEHFLAIEEEQSMDVVSASDADEDDQPQDTVVDSEPAIPDVETAAEQTEENENITQGSDESDGQSIEEDQPQGTVLDNEPATPDVETATEKTEGNENTPQGNDESDGPSIEEDQPQDTDVDSEPATLDVETAAEKTEENGNIIQESDESDSQSEQLEDNTQTNDGQPMEEEPPQDMAAGTETVMPTDVENDVPEKSALSDMASGFEALEGEMKEVAVEVVMQEGDTSSSNKPQDNPKP